MSSATEERWTHNELTFPRRLTYYKGIAWHITPKVLAPIVHSCRHRHYSRRGAERCGLALMTKLQAASPRYMHRVAERHVAQVLRGSPVCAGDYNLALQVWEWLAYDCEALPAIDSNTLRAKIQLWRQTGLGSAT